MRLFAGVPIVDDARRELVALLARLRACDWPVRWVHEEGSHLTLKFYGEVAPERLEVIEESVRFAGQGTGPLALQLGALGAFPSVSRPRVLWVGIEAPPELGLLQERLERNPARRSASRRRGRPSGRTSRWVECARGNGCRAAGWTSIRRPTPARRSSPTGWSCTRAC